MLENTNALTEAYPDQWVAIADKQVVAAGETRGEVQNAARKKTNCTEFLLYFIEGETYVYSNQYSIRLSNDELRIPLLLAL